MNTAQRTIAEALQHVRTVPRHWDQAFIKSMGWLVKHEPRKRLTPLQRYNLDLIAYRYRVQLAGHLDEELIPTVTPIKVDYVKEKEELQVDLLDGSAKAVAFDEPLEQSGTGKRGLF